MARILHAGRAAQNGLSAALFAREGLVSSDAGIEAETGFAKVLSRRHDWAEMTDGLGERWETLENTYKPFATGIVAHPAIDGCIRLRRAHRPLVRRNRPYRGRRQSDRADADGQPGA